ncbi:urease accessory protein UreF [Pseudoprimorskyibacter insulae]
MTIRTATAPTIIITMTTDPHLILHQIFSPAFPVGAFAYSHGLEAAVQGGIIGDATDLQGWLEDILNHGSGWSDAVLFAHAARGDDIGPLNELALAMVPSADRRLETEKQGAAFATCARDLWGVDLPNAAYPVAVGRLVHLLGLPQRDALRLYLQAFAANITSAGVRLIPLGQTDGQRITLALAPLHQTIADRAITADLDDIGGFVPMVDIASQRHAALYSRIFRT